MTKVKTGQQVSWQVTWTETSIKISDIQIINGNKLSHMNWNKYQNQWCTNRKWQQIITAIADPWPCPAGLMSIQATPEWMLAWGWCHSVQHQNGCLLESDVTPSNTRMDACLSLMSLRPTPEWKLAWVWCHSVQHQNGCCLESDVTPSNTRMDACLSLMSLRPTPEWMLA